MVWQEILMTQSLEQEETHNRTKTQERMIVSPSLEGMLQWIGEFTNGSNCRCYSHGVSLISNKTESLVSIWCLILTK